MDGLYCSKREVSKYGTFSTSVWPKQGQHKYFPFPECTGIVVMQSFSSWSVTRSITLQENCSMFSTLAWLTVTLAQPSPGRNEEVLAQLWMNASSITFVYFQHTSAVLTGHRWPSRAHQCSEESSEQPSNMCSWCQGTRGPVPSLSSALTTCLAKGQLPVRIAPWVWVWEQEEGEKGGTAWREREQHMLRASFSK